jgi:hypothetical protein
MTRRWLQWFALAAFILGLANFLWFWVESATMGDALQGRIENGHYILVNKGVATEVSREAWEWSSFHARSILITHPLALVAGFYLFLTTWPQIAGISVSQASASVGQIRASGSVIATTRTGARIGSVFLTKPLVRADVHPAGIVLTSFMSTLIGIATGSILSVDADRSRIGGRSIRIVHRASGVPADIRLFLADGDPLVTALRSVVAQAPSRAAASGPHEVVAIPPDRPEKYPVIYRVAMVFGLAVAIVLIAVGITIVIPKLGAFGWFWTGGLVLILLINVYRYVLRDRDRW